MTNIIEVENKIITLRDQQVILDSDVAELYGVQTKEINQAVRNNPEKFPQGYIFQLENQEFKDLRSKFFSASVTFCYFCVIIMNKAKNGECGILGTDVCGQHRTDDRRLSPLCQ